MAFIHKMAQYEPEELGFLDETSKNNKTPSRRRGRATRNRRAEMKQVFVRGRRLSATALLTIDGVAASTVVEGSMTKVKYVEFLEQQVVWAHFYQHFHSNTYLDAPLLTIPWTAQCTCYG